jgi:hypothetical protein
MVLLELGNTVCGNRISGLWYRISGLGFTCRPGAEELSRQIEI